MVLAYRRVRVEGGLPGDSRGDGQSSATWMILCHQHTVTDMQALRQDEPVPGSWPSNALYAEFIGPMLMSGTQLVLPQCVRAQPPRQLLPS